MIRRYCMGIILTVCAAVLSGCGSNPVEQKAQARSSAADQVVQAKLQDQYRKWKGVPYRLGGQSRLGVDCSGFVQLTYLQQLDQYLPRTTEDQAKIGKPIRVSELRPGDLVFFKTGLKLRHVGIYTGNNRFLHASTSRGVMISSLGNVYWREKFWQARRVE